MILQKSNRELQEIIDEIFKDGGSISQHIEEYKVRPSQKEAAEKLICAVSDKKNSIIEGPCGFGKTFVYLSTALLVSVDNQIHYPKKDRPKIVIATSGISLQEQLINKDIPNMIKFMTGTFAEILPPGGKLPTAASLKGRQNFLCPLKITKNEQVISEAAKDGQFDKIMALNENSGDLSKLDFVLNSDMRELCVCTSQHDCKNRSCPMYDECAYQKQKRAALAADIIVCNYHVLCSSLEAPLLPIYNLLIWDEAHEAADIFRQFKTESLGLSWTKFMSKMTTAIANTSFGKDIMTQLIDTGNSVGKMFDQDLSAKDFTKNLGIALSEYLQYAAKLWGVDIYNPFSATRLIFENNDSTLSDLKYNLLTLLDNITEFCSIVEDEAVDFINSGEEIPGDDFDDANSCYNYAVELHESVERRIEIIQQKSNDGIEYCYFIKKDVRDGLPILSLERMPVDIGKLFYENFIDGDCSNIFTSATLSTGGNLDFCKTQIGMNLCDPDKIFEFIGQSPFDLTHQELWYLPNECVDGNKPQFERYFLDTVKDLIKANGEGVLILTTSISAMNKAYTVVKSTVSQLRRDTMVLIQGEYPRNMLLNKFTENGRGILVATKSFFTGIDIPGKALQTLVIDKLPFNPPDDPVALYLNTKGGNVFMNYSVPNMIITLKQAVGRGVRSVTDKCVICIADGRMATARYRGKLGSSFPYEKTSTRNIENVKEFLK